jgi:hypothetical protein
VSLAGNKNVLAPRASLVPVIFNRESMLNGNKGRTLRHKVVDHKPFEVYRGVRSERSGLLIQMSDAEIVEIKAQRVVCSIFSHERLRSSDEPTPSIENVP